MIRNLLLLILICFLIAAPVSAHSAAPDDDLVQMADDPEDFTLSAAHPNPFNPRTSFSLVVNETQDVTVEVFNLLGVRVQHIYNGTMQAGESRSFTFDANDLPSGIYLYRVQGESFTATRQMTLLK